MNSSPCPSLRVKDGNLSSAPKLASIWVERSLHSSLRRNNFEHTQQEFKKDSKDVLVSWLCRLAIVIPARAYDFLGFGARVAFGLLGLSQRHTSTQVLLH